MAGSHDGLHLPDFDVDLGPELEAAMGEHRQEIEAIASGPWPPCFADTIEALERAGQRLHRAEQLFVDTSGSRSTPEVRALEAEMMPRLAAHRDAVAQDPRLFARIADLVARRHELDLDTEQACVLGRYHRDLVRAGATLDAAGQARLREINKRLSTGVPKLPVAGMQLPRARVAATSLGSRRNRLVRGPTASSHRVWLRGPESSGGPNRPSFPGAQAPPAEPGGGDATRYRPESITVDVYGHASRDAGTRAAAALDAWVGSARRQEVTGTDPH